MDEGSGGVKLRSVRRAAPVISLVAVAGAWILLQHLDRLGAPAVLPGLALLVVLFTLGLPPRPAVVPSPRTLVIAGTLLAAGLGLFFRLRYLWTVPPGYNFEPLGFVFFAQKLLDEHFPYIPYAWYAHTLYSYVIAATMLVCDSELTAFRVASAGLSLATLVALFLCMRRAVSSRAAWIAVALLASSDWHLFASRDGYHQQLLPLFQLLLVYSLLGGLQTLRQRYFVGAAAAMVVGLHAYWGFYLMPGFVLLWAAYLLVFHRDLFRHAARGLLTAAALSLIGLVPLGIFLVRRTEVFRYLVAHGFALSATNSPTLSSKLLGNLDFIVWALSGHAGAPIQCSTLLDPLVATAALVGLAISLRWFAVSVPHATFVMLLLVNVAGLAVTVSNEFYVIATMAAAYALAAIGVTTVLQQWERLHRALVPLLFIALVGLIGWQAARNYNAFFNGRIYRELKVPDRPPGTLFLLLDDIKQVVGQRAVFLPRDEPGRDFDEQLFELGKRVPSYNFMLKTLPYDATTIFFPPSVIGNADGVEVVLPEVPFAQRVALPMLRTLYPALTVTPVLAPEPYREKMPKPVAYRVSLTRADVARYYGLRELPAARGEPVMRAGLLSVPADGRYYFRTGAADTRLWVHDAPVELERGAAGPYRGVLLEAGLHPIRLRGGGDTGSGIEWHNGEGLWAPLDGALLNTGEQPASLIAPYLARPGRTADFYYSRRLRIPTSTHIQDALVAPDGTVQGIETTQLTVYDAGGAVVRRQPLPGPRNFRAARAGGREWLYGPGGTLFSVDAQAVQPTANLGCGPVDATVDGQRLLILCSDGRLKTTGGAPPLDTPLQAPDGGALPRPSEIVMAPDGFSVADAQTAQLLHYGAHGQLLGTRMLRHLYWESDVETDPAGNLYVKRRGQGLQTYSADGYLLFHPLTDRACLFVADETVALDTITPRRLKFTGNLAVAIAPSGGIEVYERRTPSAAP